MAFFDAFRKKTPVILAHSEREDWPKKLIDHHGLPKKHTQFTKTLDHKRQILLAAAGALLDEKKIQSIPERAQHLSEQHAKTINDYVEKVLSEIQFDAVLTFQEDMHAALAKLEYLRDNTNKNVSALKEYFSEELLALANASQELEDHLIKNAEAIESQIDKVVRVKKLIEQLHEERQKKRRYENTLNKYLADKEANALRQQKHNKRIAEQQSLIREQTSIDSLERIKTIEKEIHEILEKYSRLVFDTKHYLLKNGLRLSEETRELFTQLKKDPRGTLRKKHEDLKREFAELHETILSLQKEDNKNVGDRLEEAARHVIEDARKIETDEPQLHELKKQVMHDIAALNIYEQEQFLLRCAQESAEIKEKIEVISETLEEMRDEEYLQNLEQLASTMDAVIKHDEQ